MFRTWNGWMPAGLLAAWIAGATEVRAQEPRPIAVEGTVGWAGWADDGRVEHHAVYGAGARVPLWRRISVGPEFSYMVGPDSDRDAVLLGSMWIDLVSPAADSPVIPYVVFSGGYLAHRDERGRDPNPWQWEGAFTAGVGARGRVNDRLYVGADVRLGWSLHVRAAAHVGVTWGR